MRLRWQSCLGPRRRWPAVHWRCCRSPRRCAAALAPAAAGLRSHCSRAVAHAPSGDVPDPCAEGRGRGGEPRGIGKVAECCAAGGAPRITHRVGIPFLPIIRGMSGIDKERKDAKEIIEGLGRGRCSGRLANAEPAVERSIPRTEKTGAGFSPPRGQHPNARYQVGVCFNLAHGPGKTSRGFPRVRPYKGLRFGSDMFLSESFVSAAPGRLKPLPHNRGQKPMVVVTRCP